MEGFRRVFPVTGERCKARFSRKLILGVRERWGLERSGDLSQRGKLRGDEEKVVAVMAFCGAVVELLRCIWGWHAGYPNLKAVRVQWLLGLMTCWERQILEAEVAR